MTLFNVLPAGTVRSVIYLVAELEFADVAALDCAANSTVVDPEPNVTVAVPTPNDTVYEAEPSDTLVESPAITVVAALAAR